MSINNSNNSPLSSPRVFDEYSVSEGSSNSFYEENNLRRQEQSASDVKDFDTYALKKPYSIPLNVVRSKVNKVYFAIESTLSVYEDILDNVYINPYLNPDIEECHIHLWQEINKNYPSSLNFIEDEDQDKVFAGGSSRFDETTGQYKEVSPPDYISFKQYVYAEKHGCRGCRKLVKEYDKAISHSMFIHFFDYRYYLTMLLHETECIKESLISDFGVEYDDESQEQAAIAFFAWAKMAENHTRLIAEELNEPKKELPSSEVDSLSKKQTAQFQAFFSIRITSYSEAIDNLLFSLKKYLIDTCDIFYEKYVSPAIKFKTKVAAPLELDMLTTRMTIDAPMLSEEVVTAVNAFRGNFGSILTDMTQRRNNIQEKFDILFSLNRQRKKYIDYIDQLSIKAISRPKVIVTVEKDIYSNVFNQIIIDPSERETLFSTHGSLDGLLEDHHPQYLLRSGGAIFGDIIVEDGITIDGVDLSSHSHTGEDGSVKIKSTDIDYDSVREETSILQTEEGNQFSVSIDSFESDTRIGGVPVVNAIVSISIPDDIADKYEFEIIYMEN